VNLLLDTNVLSEAQRPAPNLKVLGWLDAVDEDRVFISVASIAELRRGVALTDDADAPRWPPGSPAICRHASPSGSCRLITRSPSTGAT
jgi:hypothetical protein